METKPLSPDQLIEGLGGCGRYQIRLSVLVHLIMSATVWSVFSIAIISKTPPWWCADDTMRTNVTSHQNESMSLLKSCLNRNGSTCERIVFDDSLRTIASEFELVCDKAFIPSTVMSIQLAGMLIGSPVSGQIADLIGRKKPFFLALVILTVFNLLGYFSTNWIMFAVCRFFIGLGGSFFLTVRYNLLSEFTLASWRGWIISFPSWSIESCIIIFLAWLLRDWRYINLSCSILSALCLLSWRLIPESFRWYLSHDRQNDAENVIKVVAAYNKQPMPDRALLSPNENKTKGDRKKYTFLHLFKTRSVAKLTILLASNWFALGFVAYGLLFGVQSLSGNLFLNLFLFQITSIPVKCLTSYLLNRIGRRSISLLSFSVTCVGGLVVGIVQYVDTPYRLQLTNGFALVANMGITAGWGSVQTMTVELYPTVIRNIGFGTLSTIARFGAILGPQIAFLDTIIPGTLYFMSAGISAVCIVALMFLPETKGGNLPDKINEVERVMKPV